MPISDFQNKHSGERVFLIGNGPSIQDTPLSLIKDEYSIAMNQIYDIFPETEWRPTYYLQVNPPPYVVEKMYTGVLDMVERGITSFVAKGAKPGLKEFEQYDDAAIEDHVQFVELMRPERVPAGRLIRDADRGEYTSFWSTDLVNGFYFKSTSMYVAAQIASYMGFDEFYFVGCDLYPEFTPVPYAPFEAGSNVVEFNAVSGTWQDYFDFIIQDGAPLRSLFNGIWFKSIYDSIIVDLLYEVYKKGGRMKQTHFTKGQTNTKFYGPGKNKALINAHKIISLVGEYEGFTCYNATKGGDLEVHPRTDIGSLIT